MYSPRIAEIEVVRRGKVRRAKLYYLRDRQGKSARIAERSTGRSIESENNKQSIKTSPSKKQKSEDASEKKSD